MALNCLESSDRPKPTVAGSIPVPTAIQTSDVVSCLRFFLLRGSGVDGGHTTVCKTVTFTANIAGSTPAALTIMEVT